MASVSTPGRIAMTTAALALGVGLWASNGALHRADELEAGESATPVEPERPVLTWTDTRFAARKSPDSGHRSVDAFRGPSEATGVNSSARHESEARLDDAGETARRRLVERQAARLRQLADKAEGSGNPERARLMRARVAYLEAAGRELEHSPED